MASSIIPGTEGSPRKRWKIYTLSRDSHNSPGLQISRKIPGSMYFALCNCNRAWSNEVIANAPQCGGPQSRRNTMKIRIIQTSLPLPGSRFTLKVLWNAQKPRVGGIVSWCSINGKGCRVEWKKIKESCWILFTEYYAWTTAIWSGRASSDVQFFPPASSRLAFKLVVLYRV